MNRRTTFMSLVMSGLAIVAIPVDAQPETSSWEERLLLQWTNRARSDPQYEMQRCPSGNCPDAPCYTPVAPVGYSEELSRAARFQASFVNLGGAFAHDNNCVVRSDIDGVYPDICNGDPDCACASGGTTRWYQRVSLFGGTARAENLAYGYWDANSAFYGWLHERSSNSSCDTSGGKGHRFNLLTAGPSLGNGVEGQVYAQDFGYGVTPRGVVSGVHYPEFGSTIELWANWYDPSSAPTSATVHFDGVSLPLTLSRGSMTNGSWSTVVTGLGSACYPYFFSFSDGSSTHRYPENGSFVVGSASNCPSWVGQAGPVEGDFDWDGNADIVLRNYATGKNALWLMQGTVFGSVRNLPTLPDTSYLMAATSDIDGDGDPDIFWRDGASGRNAIWVLENGLLVSTINLPTLPNLDFEIGGTGDFDRNGSEDVLWRNRVTGANAIWLMRGASLDAIVNLPQLTNTAYEFAGVGDLDGDGDADIVLRNYSTGQTAIWIMDGASYATTINLPTVPDTDLRIEALADYDGDGNTDLVWRNVRTGANAIWLMSGTSLSSIVNLPTLPDTAWAIAGPR